MNSRAATLDQQQADLAACRVQLGNGSRTFLAASLLLPRSVRDPACALYAFCRQADDAVDGPQAAADAIDALRARLDAVYDDRPKATPADRAFAAVVQRFDIPRALPDALIDGFGWDASGRHLETLADVEAYAARVAGSVGAMMSIIMGARSTSALARACDLGVAMQLSNIARDVGEDARLGRIYLPRQWLQHAGLDVEAWLAKPHAHPAIASALARLLAVAEALYARAAHGVAELPRGCRAGIHAARLLYAEIGHQVARDGLAPIDRRAVVGAPRKVGLLLRAVGSSLLPTELDHAPALPATRFLVEAAARDMVPAAHPRWSPSARVAGLIALLDRLERRDAARAHLH
jgi:phytoene synthase